MKSIINAKNALALLFLIPILTSAISFAMPDNINYKVPTTIYLCCYLILGLSCLYLAYTDNKFIKSKTHKISMYLLASYYIIFDGLINRLPSLISENYTIFNIIKNICEDQTMQTFYASLVYAFLGLFFYIIFLMFIWGIPTKKSTKWLLTLLFFTPYIVRGVTPILEVSTEYQDLICQTFDITCYGLMLFLVTKAYKKENITD